MTRSNWYVWGIAAWVAMLAFAPLSLADEAAPAEATTPAAVGDVGEIPEATAPTTTADVWQGLVTFWYGGGATMYFLAGLAVVALVFSVDRLISLQRGGIAPRGLADRANRLWEAGKHRELRYLCGELTPKAGEKLADEKGKPIRPYRSSTLGSIIAFLSEHRSNSYEHLTAAAEDLANRDFETHNRRCYPLAAVGTLAPLLGLLGTVIGLRGAFATIGTIGTMDDPSALAGDIGIALITTATGLIIAIPALIIYHFFRTRTSLFASILGQEVNNLMHAWFLKREADHEG